MGCRWEKVALGDTGLSVMPLGLAASYGVGGVDLERAFDRGIDYFYWGSARTSSFRDGMRAIGKRDRAGAVFVVQSYTRVAALMRPSLERALRQLGTDYADVLLLGWWNRMPPRAILDAARTIRERGLARKLMISCHQRPSFASYIDDPTFDAIMLRYNAAHPGGETEVFPHLARRNVGVVAYTATRWGDLLDPAFTPSGDRTPSASDCYRFALTNPHVHLCVAGPASGLQLDEAMSALDRGPMSEDELAWMKRVGVAVRSAGIARTRNRAMQVVDTLMDWMS